MREYFTVLIRENETTNLKLLTEKLNAGFSIDRRDDIGRSMLYILRKNNYEADSLTRTVPTRAYAPEEGLAEGVSYGSSNIATDVPF